MPESRMHPVAVVAPAVDQTVLGLPIGTRVMRVDPFPDLRRRSRLGWVVPHQPEYSRGSFPVRWDDGIWEAGLDVSDVTVVPEQEQEATVTTLPLRSTSRTARAV